MNPIIEQKREMLHKGPFLFLFFFASLFFFFFFLGGGGRGGREKGGTGYASMYVYQVSNFLSIQSFH